jgi:hypothetical protein
MSKCITSEIRVNKKKMAWQLAVNHLSEINFIPSNNKIRSCNAVASKFSTDSEKYE